MSFQSGSPLKISGRSEAVRRYRPCIFIIDTRTISISFSVRDPTAKAGGLKELAI